MNTNTLLRAPSAPRINWSSPQAVDTPVNPLRRRIAPIDARLLRHIGASNPSSSKTQSLDAVIWLAQQIRLQQEQQTG